MRSYSTIKSKQTRNKKLKFKRGVGISIKRMETSSKLHNYLAMKLLTTHSTSHIGYYLCLFMQTQLQLGSYSYIHACTNETHSMANLQDLIPTLAALIIGNTS